MTTAILLLVFGQCSNGTCKVPEPVENPFVIRKWDTIAVENLLEKWQKMEEVDTSGWDRETRLEFNRKKAALKRKLRKLDDARRMEMVLYYKQQKAWADKMARQQRLRNKKVYHPSLGGFQSQVQAISLQHFYNNCYPYYRW